MDVYILTCVLRGIVPQECPEHWLCLPQELVEWLVEKDIVRALLRAHLHQRQYMDQVQRVLKILAAEGGFQSDHLELLWALTEKARPPPARSRPVCEHHVASQHVHRACRSKVHVGRLTSQGLVLLHPGRPAQL